MPVTTGNELHIPIPQGTDFVETTHNDSYPLIDPTKLDMTGKHVLIIGASRGIGVEIAKSFAAAGASGIGLAARGDLSSTINEVKKAAVAAKRPVPKIFNTRMDISDIASIGKASEAIVENLGHLDIVISNAATITPFASVTESDPDSWWSTWEVNIRGAYLVARKFVPILLKSPNPDKSLVWMTSAAAHNVVHGGSAYHMSKLVLIRLAEFLVTEYAAQGLLTYSLHPGGSKTSMTDKLPIKISENCLDEPRLAGDTLAWLTSERRDWLAGRYLSANWDMAELLQKKTEIVENDLLKIKLAV